MQLLHWLSAFFVNVKICLLILPAPKYFYYFFEYFYILSAKLIIIFKIYFQEGNIYATSKKSWIIYFNNGNNSIVTFLF